MDHVTSRNLGLCEAEKRDPGNEVCLVETNFKNDEHSALYRWVTNFAGVRDTEKTFGNQPRHGAESRNPASTALLGVDIMSPLC